MTDTDGAAGGPPGFCVSHARDGGFRAGGLRAYFEYRDLGVAAATDGLCHAQVIRARPQVEGHAGAHYHDIQLQLVYVLKGWVRFHYEGVGEVLLEPGSCVHQPPGIRHAELDHSDDLELLEITMPAAFATHEL